MSRYEPKLLPGGYVKGKGQPSAEKFEEYLTKAAEIVGNLEKLHEKGHTPNVSSLLKRQYVVLDEIGKELKLYEKDSGIPQYEQILTNFNKYAEYGDLSVLDGTAALIISSIKAIINRTNRFVELDDKVKASGAGDRVFSNVEKRLVAERGKKGFGSIVHYRSDKDYKDDIKPENELVSSSPKRTTNY